MLLDIVEIDSNDWCAAKFVQLISCAGRQTSLGTTGMPVLIIRIVSWFEQAPDEVMVLTAKARVFDVI